MSVRNLIKRVLKRVTHKVSPQLHAFNEQLKTFKTLNNETRFVNSEIDKYPCLDDNTQTTLFDTHYIYHPAWAARVVRDINPELHVDISSTLHFCSILSAFVKTAFYDYRPALLNLDNLTSLHADLTSLHFETNSLESLSCMHTIEHIGLGRYGDPLDPDADLKAIAELKRVCALNGNLLLVTPVGVKRVQFNAHRVYDPFDIVKYMDGFTLKKFSLVCDDGTFVDDASLEMAAGERYGCGCYWFIKNKN